MNAIEFFLVSLLESKAYCVVHIAKRNEVYLLVSADERYWVFFLEHPWIHCWNPRMASCDRRLITESRSCIDTRRPWLCEILTH